MKMSGGGGADGGVDWRVGSGGSGGGGVDGAGDGSVGNEGGSGDGSGDGAGGGGVDGAGGAGDGSGGGGEETIRPTTVSSGSPIKCTLFNPGLRPRAVRNVPSVMRSSRSSVCASSLPATQQRAYDPKSWITTLSVRSNATSPLCNACRFIVERRRRWDNTTPTNDATPWAGTVTLTHAYSRPIVSKGAGESVPLKSAPVAAGVDIGCGGNDGGNDGGKGCVTNSVNPYMKNNNTTITTVVIRKHGAPHMRATTISVSLSSVFHV